MSRRESVFEELIIESSDGTNSVDVVRGVRSIDYYEDLFSPVITCKITVVTTGDALPGKDGKGIGIYNGLPLRGGEKVSIKIRANSETNKALDFASSPEDYLYVSGVSNVIAENQRESFTLNLVPKEAIINETTRVLGRYPTDSPIDVSVQKILDDYIKTDKPVKIDTTSNTYGFIGNMKRPFNVLVWLASKSVSSTSGGAGFVFYQTQEGFNFRSIDALISEGPVASYVYTDIVKSPIEENNDFKILQYSIDRNQNLVEKLRLGTFATFRQAFNPLDCKFTLPEEGLFTEKDHKTKNLGQEVKIPNFSGTANQGLGDTPSRLITQVFDVGTVEKDVSQKQNADPFEYQSQSLLRYNLLFTQTLQMTVPLNTNLKAGDVIECDFPKVSRNEKPEYDDEQSGLYMIKELCHHYDNENSLTSMKLVRDTYGKYGTNSNL